MGSTCNWLNDDLIFVEPCMCKERVNSVGLPCMYIQSFSPIINMGGLNA